MKKLSFLVVLFFVASFASCKKECTDGDEYPRGAIRELPPFTGINVQLSAVIELIKDTSGITPFVELVVEENVQPYLATEVTNNILNISLSRCFSSHADILIRVHYDSINSITVSGPGDVKSNTLMNQDELTLNIKSSGDIDLTTNIKNLESNIEGTGIIFINGQIGTHTINHNNSGNINTYQATTDSVIANLTGTGNIYTRVNHKLTAVISNSGDIFYKGFPIIDETLTSTGEVIDDN